MTEDPSRRGAEPPEEGAGPPSGGEPPTFEQPPTEPPPAGSAPGPSPRRLLRSRDDRLLGGVAGGLGRYFNVDPVIFRIGFVVVALVGGAGLLAYLGALLAIPREPGPGEAGPAPAYVGNRLVTFVGAVVLGLAVITALANLGQGFGGFFGGPLLLLGLVGVLVYALARRGDGGLPGGGDVGTRIAIAVVLLLVAAIGFAGSAWAAASGWGVAVAAVVIALGMALVGAAFRGGARWLAIPALALAVPLAFVSAADIDLRGGFGERDHRPASAAVLPPSYGLGAGQMRIDLRGVALPPGERRLGVHVGAGRAVVVVSPAMCVETSGGVGMGRLASLGRGRGGLNVSIRDQSTAAPGVPRLVLEPHIGMGEFLVVTDPREAQRFGDHEGRFRDFRDDSGDDDSGGGPFGAFSDEEEDRRPFDRFGGERGPFGDRFDDDRHDFAGSQANAACHPMPVQAGRKEMPR